MRRIIIVYNPRSSRALRVCEEVLDVARGMKGVMVGRFEVKKGPIVENAARLEKMLSDGDVIVTAGGDGTTEVGVNAAMMTNKDVSLAALAYGNFNDVARMFGVKGIDEVLNGETVEAFPIEARVNGKHYQYTMGYFTVGMFAKATEVFEKRKVRGELKQKGGGLVYSIWNLARWYFRHRKEVKVFRLELNGKKMVEATDILAVNGVTAAKVMKGGRYYLGKKRFLLGVGRLDSFLRLMKYMMKSMTRRVPGNEVESEKVRFEAPTGIVLQAEGEYVELEEVREIEFLKSKKAIKVFCGKTVVK